MTQQNSITISNSTKDIATIYAELQQLKSTVLTYLISDTTDKETQKEYTRQINTSFAPAFTFVSQMVADAVIIDIEEQESITLEGHEANK